MSKYKIDKTKLKTYQTPQSTIRIVPFYHNIEKFRAAYSCNSQELWTLVLSENNEYLKMIKKELALKLAQQILDNNCVNYTTNCDNNYNLLELAATIAVVKNSQTY